MAGATQDPSARLPGRLWNMAAPSKQRVVDTHIHLAENWRPGMEGLRNDWLPEEKESFHNLHWTEVSTGVSREIIISYFN